MQAFAYQHEYFQSYSLCVQRGKGSFSWSPNDNDMKCVRHEAEVLAWLMDVDIVSTVSTQKNAPRFEQIFLNLWADDFGQVDYALVEDVTSRCAELRSEIPNCYGWFPILIEALQQRAAGMQMKYVPPAWSDLANNVVMKEEFLRPIVKEDCDVRNELLGDIVRPMGLIQCFVIRNAQQWIHKTFAPNNFEGYVIVDLKRHKGRLVKAREAVNQQRFSTDCQFEDGSTLIGQVSVVTTDTSIDDSEYSSTMSSIVQKVCEQLTPLENVIRVQVKAWLETHTERLSEPAWREIVNGGWGIIGPLCLNRDVPKPTRRDIRRCQKIYSHVYEKVIEMFPRRDDVTNQHKICEVAKSVRWRIQ